MKNLDWLPYLLFLIFIFLAGFPVLSIKKEFEIEPRIVKQGEPYKLWIEYCKRLPIPAKFQISYIGELVYPAPETYTTNSETGCHNKSFQFRIPDDLPAGEYVVESNISYPPFLRTLTFRSEKFIVVEGKTTKQSLNDIIELLNSWEVTEE